MELPLLFSDRLVATIAASAQSVALTYSPEWLAAPDRFPISLSMPLGDMPYQADLVLPWLTNLLPEGEPLRAMTRMLGASPEDVLGLISETGSDLAGALSVAPARHDAAPGYQVIPDDETLEKIIHDLPARPFLADEEGVAMSLAGAQDKLPVALDGSRITIPLNGAPSTHILKPENVRLPGSVQNEALCMVLARRIGLHVAPVTTGLAGERSYLLVERYDRRQYADGVSRIHQEDFCQALGRPPSAKYEFNGTGTRGPSLAEMFALVRQHMTARDINNLLDAVIFNIAIGNVDSHAKNYSALLEPSGIRLAPLYDLMTGLAWDGITQNHAQAVGDQRRGRYIYGRHWERMAHVSGLAARATVRRVQAITDQILSKLPAAVDEVAAMPAGDRMLTVFASEIARRSEEVRLHAGKEREDHPAEPESSGSADPAADATAYHG